MWLHMPSNCCQQRWITYLEVNLPNRKGGWSRRNVRGPPHDVCSWRATWPVPTAVLRGYVQVSWGSPRATSCCTAGLPRDRPDSGESQRVDGGECWSTLSVYAIPGSECHATWGQLEETLSEDIRAVIKNVESSLKERGHAMERGVIHGDFQDYNIILHPATVDFKTSVASLDSKTIFGIIDFNDICYTYRVFEVGRLIADAMTNCNCSDQEALQIGGRILSGYLSIRPLNIEDMTMLYHAVCITFCQYYVLGQHAVSQQTDNPYCSLGFAEAGRWLERVLALSSRTLWEIWTPVLSEAGISL
ncbi:hydroxylysine kinase-like isoform X4 [Haliotis rubra]|uniref:hydroxylysine kinase-like isoform X4 n=1 Tax=Haliotis rubra TaxID=36100 RepID=UPI001EE55170|nr:hydroxylysine kinase-like isoform X4 [Haliotis rubra]